MISQYTYRLFNKFINTCTMSHGFAHTFCYLQIEVTKQCHIIQSLVRFAMDLIKSVSKSYYF